MINLDHDRPIWDQFFTVAPLVVIGTKEADGFDLAPKHMVSPIGLDNYFAFVCTPRHGTYQNVKKHSRFTVSFPKPNQITLASLSASPRCDDVQWKKPILSALPTVKAPGIDGVFLDDCYLALNCELIKIVDGFGDHSLICGKITHAFVDKAYQRISDKDDQEMIYRSPLLAYLAHGRFAKIEKSYAFPFPKEYKN